MISSSNVLYGASSNDPGSVLLLQATTSLTPVEIVENDTGKTIVYRAKAGGDTIPDPQVHKVQPFNLRGETGNQSDKSVPHTDKLPLDILQQHYAGQRYLGCSAYDDNLRTHWVQVDCDHGLDEFLAKKGITYSGLTHIIRTAVDQASPDLKYGIFRTRNNYAINFYFDKPITRRHQQALYMLVFSKVYAGADKWPMECLPDNPFLPGQHPAGRTPIMRGFAIRDPEARRGVGCLIDGPIDRLIAEYPPFDTPHPPNFVKLRLDAADQEDDICADLWNEIDFGPDLERLAKGYEQRGIVYDDNMTAFYKNVLGQGEAKQPGTALATAVAAAVTAPKHKDAEDRDPAELEEMISAISLRKSLNVTPRIKQALFRMSPCLLNKMWDPEVGKQANQNTYARHILVEVQRAERMGLIKDDEMEDLHTVLCHLSMDDGDAPGETQRVAIKPYLRRLHDKTESKNPSCSDCRAASLCNKEACATAEGGFLRENGNQALTASGVHPICKTFCRPVQLVVRVNNEFAAIPFPHALKLAPIKNIIESAGASAPRLPKEKAYAATVSGLPQLSLSEIYSHPSIKGKRITGLHSLDARLLRYMSNHWVTPLQSTRKVEGAHEERPAFTQLGGSTIYANDTTLFFGWEDLVAAAASVIAQTSTSYGPSEVPPATVAALFERPDTEAVTFVMGAKAPVPLGVLWCSIQIEEFNQLAERNAAHAPQ